MKKIFTLLATTLLSVSLFAFAPRTALTVNVNSKKATTILIDGRMYKDRQHDGNTTINNLSAGAHNVKVYQQNNNGRFNNNAPQLIYDGNVYVKPQSNTILTINKNGRSIVSEKPMSDLDYPSNNENGGWNYRYPQAMNDRGFDQFRFTVNKTSFENPKMDIGKEVISQNYFTADQIKTLLESFNYESSKLEMAKYAYDRTLDKENYYTLINAFTYSISKQDFTRFLQQQR